jgi:hypothetical protein
MCLCMYVGRGRYHWGGGWPGDWIIYIYTYYIYSILYFRHDMVQKSTTICYKQGWQRRIELAEIVLGSREGGLDMLLHELET